MYCETLSNGQIVAVGMFRLSSVTLCDRCTSPCPLASASAQPTESPRLTVLQYSGGDLDLFCPSRYPFPLPIRPFPMET